MFTLHFSKVYGFDAESAKEKIVRASSSQTEEFKNVEKECQVGERQNVQVQTDSIQISDNIFAEYDPDNLSKFLNRVTPHVCTVLEKNVKSKAFVNYELLSDLESSSIMCLNILERPLQSQLNCCNISWNSVGTSIAAAYTNNIHEDWCDHDGSIGIWSLNRKNFDPQKPNIVLETDCCITCVVFHPKIPALLLAGKYSGEIMVWNISKDDDNLLGSSKANLSNHREPITDLYWLPESNSYDDISFLSCSLDGKILIWNLKKTELIPVDGYIVLADQFPRNFEIKSTRDNSEVGIVSMSINYEDPSIFMMGTEGGGIVQGSFNNLVPASYSGVTSIPLKNPVTMCFGRHKGQITSVRFSKFSRNIFLSSGSDGELRIYTLLQKKPLITLLHVNCSVNDAEWSLVRPMVLSCICSDGQLHIWDLMANLKQPTESVHVDSKYAAGMSLKYNHESKNLMANSSSDGKIQIWQLPGFMMKPLADELQQLQNLSKSIE